jgi:ADP-ribose pyrophosphatase YjhB (NUDIX family)
MWVITNFGFFSVVQKPDDAAGDTVTIRARVKSDLEALRQKYLPQLGNILQDAGIDYKYRAKALRLDFANALHHIVLNIDYSNFKDSVAKQQGSARSHLYHNLWEVLYQLQEVPPITSPKPSTKVDANVSYGGVLFDKESRVLLRKPRGEFDNYVWTFPKGRVQLGVTAEETALLEVFKETGYRSTLIGKVPGRFVGGTGANEYFLMQPLGEAQPFDPDETEEVVWVPYREAAAYIEKTRNAIGWQRDLAVLQASVKAATAEGLLNDMGKPSSLAALFQNEPIGWGTRGDPYLWMEMKQQFESVSYPDTPEELITAVEGAFIKLTGHSIYQPDTIYIEKYSHGGMSSGHVCPEFWRSTVLPLLRERFFEWPFRNEGICHNEQAPEQKDP